MVILLPKGRLTLGEELLIGDQFLLLLGAAGSFVARGRFLLGLLAGGLRGPGQLRLLALQGSQLSLALFRLPLLRLRQRGGPVLLLGLIQESQHGHVVRLTLERLLASLNRLRRLPGFEQLPYLIQLPFILPGLLPDPRLVGRISADLAGQLGHAQFQLLLILHVNAAQPVLGARLDVDKVRRHVEARRLLHDAEREVAHVQRPAQPLARRDIDGHVAHAQPQPAHVPEQLAAIDDLIARGEVGRQVVCRPVAEARRCVHRIGIDDEVEDGHARPGGHHDHRRRIDDNNGS